MIEKRRILSRINPKLHDLVDKNSVVDEQLALDLLTPSRFDVLAKLLYVRCRAAGIKSQFHYEMYTRHIEVLNGFFEDDASKKLGPKSFLKAFNDLIDSALYESKLHGDTTIPVGFQGVPIDGAHRLAMGVFLQSTVKTVRLKHEEQRYDFERFRNGGLEEVYLDEMALEYVRRKPGTRAAFVWPSAKGKDNDLLEVISNHSEIVYRKDIRLSDTGKVNLIRLVYQDEPWLGEQSDGFAGAVNKTSWCFNNGGPVRLFLVDANTRLLKMKEDIREIFGVGKHSIHVADTHEDTSRLAAALLNQNGLHLLNYATGFCFPWFDRLFTDYKKWIESRSLERDRFCIDGSCVLAAYGVREARDLDFLYCGQPEPRSGFREIDCHNSSHMHLLSVDEIVNDPRNYFSVDGYKFLSLALIESMKARRNEFKDQEDIARIRSLKSGQIVSRDLFSWLKKTARPAYIRGRVKFLLLKARYLLMRFARSLKS